MNPIKLLTILHVALGTIALVAGTAVLFVKKGDKTHRKLGNIFSYSMQLAGFTALILAIIHPNIFLFIVGIFSIYLVGTGNRHIYLKLKGDVKAKPHWLDWSLTILMLVSGIIFIGYGGYLIAKGASFAIVLLLFGLIGLSGVRQDFKYYRGLEKDRMYWLRIHIARMTGGYIAGSTAFLVNNIKHLPALHGFIYWLFPTLLIVPLMIKWLRKYTPQKEN